MKTLTMMTTNAVSFGPVEWITTSVCIIAIFALAFVFGHTSTKRS